MVMTYKCPFCGSEMRFDEKSRMLLCDACDNRCEVDEFKIQTPEEFAEAFSSGQAEEECEGYVCRNCGAKIIKDDSDFAVFCGYCGAPAIKPTRITGAVKPELILPFKIDKAAAQRAFAAWFGKKPLIPGGFSETARAGKISGIYVPFWMYDCEVETRLHAESFTVSGSAEKTETKHFSHYRRVMNSFSSVPADASKRMDKKLMDMLGPFDYSLLTEFDPAYMSGFCAEKHSLKAEQLLPQIKDSVDECAAKAAVSTLGTLGGAPRVTSCEHCYTKCRAKYALLPVWTINYTYNNYTHQFFMNGQTGKIVGEPPISLRRVLAWFCGIAGTITLLGEFLILAVNYF